LAIVYAAGKFIPSRASRYFHLRGRRREWKIQTSRCKRRAVAVNAPVNPSGVAQKFAGDMSWVGKIGVRKSRGIYVPQPFRRQDKILVLNRCQTALD